jgi:hypothetical protein
MIAFIQSPPEVPRFAGADECVGATTQSLDEVNGADAPDSRTHYTQMVAVLTRLFTVSRLVCMAIGLLP